MQLDRIMAWPGLVVKHSAIFVCLLCLYLGSVEGDDTAGPPPSIRRILGSCGFNGDCDVLFLSLLSGIG